MRRSHLWICVSVAFASLQPALVRANTAEDAFAKGKTLLAKAEFQPALAAFAEAVRGDRGNTEYLQHYTIVRQVVALRERLETEQDPVRWEYVGRGLHAFYVSQGIYGEALSLDQRIHRRLKTALSAMMLAETQLAVGRNAEAGAVLASLDPAKQTAATRALHGIALARQGKVREAREVAGRLQLPGNVDAHTMYSVARLHAGVGNTKQAIGLLTRCLQSVPPSRLDALKSEVRHSPEFAGLASTPEFAMALKTKSKVPESKCSGGTGCAGCPMRGGCPRSQGR